MTYRTLTISLAAADPAPAPTARAPTQATRGSAGSHHHHRPPAHRRSHRSRRSHRYHPHHGPFAPATIHDPGVHPAGTTAISVHLIDVPVAIIIDPVVAGLLVGQDRSHARPPALGQALLRAVHGSCTAPGPRAVGVVVAPVDLSGHARRRVHGHVDGLGEQEHAVVVVADGHQGLVGQRPACRSARRRRRAPRRRAGRPRRPRSRPPRARPRLGRPGRRRRSAPPRRDRPRCPRRRSAPPPRLAGRRDDVDHRPWPSSEPPGTTANASAEGRLWVFSARIWVTTCW